MDGAGRRGQWYSYNPGYSGGWSNSIPILSSVQAASNVYNNFAPWPAVNYTCVYIDNYIMRDWDGASQPLNIAIAQQNTTQNGCDQATYQPVNVFNGGDDFFRAATFYSPTYSQPQAPTAVTVADAEGAVYSFPSQGNLNTNSQDYLAPTDPNYASRFGTSFWGQATSIEDRNGNLLTVGNGGITDDAGRQVITFSGQNISVLGQSSPYTLSAVTGTSQNSNFNVAQTVTGVFPQVCYSIRSTTLNVGGTQTLTLPNGQSYQFQYDPTYGLLSKITYPDGGYVSYTWGINLQSESIQLPQIQSSQYQGSCYANYDFPAIISRTVSYDGSTIAEVQNFSYSTGGLGLYPNIVWTSKQTTVTTEDYVRGTSYTTVYNYGPGYTYSAVNSFGGSLSPTPQEQSTVYKDGNGTVLKTVYKTWVPAHFSLLSCELEQLDSNGPISATWYAYGSGGQITDKKEYDYGVITSNTACNSVAPSNPTRETVTTYQSFPATKIFPTVGSIFDKPATVQVYAGSRTSGTLMAETDYTYDAYGTAGIASLTATGHDDTNYATTNQNRGNLTKKTVRCLQTSCDAVTTYTYDQTGNITSVTDPCGNGPCSDMTGTGTHTTQFDYTDSYSNHSAGGTYAYLTKITDPLSHQQTFSYDYNSGELTVSKNQNDITAGRSGTTFTYNDIFFRPTLVNYPDGGQTAISYNDTSYPPSVTTCELISGTAGATCSPSAPPTGWKTSIAVMDGVRHVTQTQLISDPDGADFVDTTYDGSGLGYTQSNPHRSSALLTDGTTTTDYDALGRPLLVRRPDGSLVSTIYEGNCTTITDEAGAARKSCSDAFGRLTEVDEPGAGSAAGTPGTATLTVGGSEQTYTFNPCPPPQQACWQTIPDSGTVTVDVNGVDMSVQFGPPVTTQEIASSIANVLNGPASLVKATVNGSLVTITALTNGADTNFSVTTSSTWQTQYFASPSFTACLNG